MARAYDNYRVTGHPLRLPYREYYERYEIVPLFSIVPISKTPRTSRYFDLESRNRETYERARSLRLFIDRPLDWLTLFRWYFGNLVWLLLLVVFMPALWRSKRTRFVLILTAIIAAASLIEVWWRGGGDWRIHRFFRVAASDIPLLIEETKARLSGAGQRESYDNILRALVRAGRFFAEDITGIPWSKIDFPEDVAYANNIILTALQDRAARL